MLPDVEELSVKGRTHVAQHKKQRTTEPGTHLVNTPVNTPGGQGVHCFDFVLQKEIKD